MHKYKYEIKINNKLIGTLHTNERRDISRLAANVKARFADQPHENSILDINEEVSGQHRNHRYKFEPFNIAGANQLERWIIRMYPATN